MLRLRPEGSHALMCKRAQGRRTERSAAIVHARSSRAWARLCSTRARRGLPLSGPTTSGQVPGGPGAHVRTLPHLPIRAARLPLARTPHAAEPDLALASKGERVQNGARLDARWDTKPLTTLSTTQARLRVNEGRCKALRANVSQSTDIVG